MSRKRAIEYFDEYLKRNNISCMKDYDAEIGCMRYTFEFSAHKAPGGFVEACIWWYERDAAEVRIYYNAEGMGICRESEYREALFELLNWMNARIFMRSGTVGGIYEPSMIYTPRIYQTVDGYCDITITSMINYEVWAMTPLETNDYITIYCPELLDILAPAIFGVLMGELKIAEAIAYLEKEVVC